MKSVAILPSAKAREALIILEQAYAYYTPDPIRLPVADMVPGVLVPYYSAA